VHGWSLDRFDSRQLPEVFYRMPAELMRMPQQNAVGRDRAACPAQPGIAADRFAREIVGILKAFPARARQLNAKPLGRGRANASPNNVHRSRQISFS